MDGYGDEDCLRFRVCLLPPLFACMLNPVMKAQNFVENQSMFKRL